MAALQGASMHQLIAVCMRVSACHTVLLYNAYHVQKIRWFYYKYIKCLSPNLLFC